jgi:hypothetical protein
VQVQDIETAESLELLHIGCNRIVVNSNNTVVIEAMKSGDAYLGLAAAVLNDCK